MAEQVPFEVGAEDFAVNPEPRVACVLLLDRSGSMDGEPIRQLNEALKQFREEIAADPLAAKRAEIAIISFGSGIASVDHEFSTVDTFVPPELQADGDTPMGQAILKGIDLVKQRKETYKQHGVMYYRPWIFLITDGAPTDRWDEAAKQVKDGEAANAFSFFSVGVDAADMSLLKQISKRTEPLKLKGTRFSDLFQWLSRSLSSVSQSKPSEKVKLENPTGPSGWGEIGV